VESVVAVPCPRCGREYDAALFPFGRTLWCACGSRVGMAPRVRQIEQDGEKRFLADAMLGRLARWLRILGFDCAWERDIRDADLVRRAVCEQRILLSRDRSLPQEWRVSDIHLLESEELREQLREVIARYRLAPAIRLFSRCNQCNQPLRAAAPAEVAARVPPRVASAHQHFLECPGCRRVYWQASHAERIRRLVGELLAPA
jgi:uncharacterized protein with PIN domain